MNANDNAENQNKKSPFDKISGTVKDLFIGLDCNDRYFAKFDIIGTNRDGKPFKVPTRIFSDNFAIVRQIITLTEGMNVRFYGNFLIKEENKKTNMPVAFFQVTNVQGYKVRSTELGERTRLKIQQSHLQNLQMMPAA